MLRDHSQIDAPQAIHSRCSPNASVHARVRIFIIHCYVKVHTVRAQSTHSIAEDLERETFWIQHDSPKSKKQCLHWISGKYGPTCRNSFGLKCKVSKRQLIGLESHTTTMSTSLATLQEQLQIGSEEYSKLQSELSNVVEARQKLDAQLQENELVKKVRTMQACRDLRSYNIVDLLISYTLFHARGNMLCRSFQS